MSNNIVTDFTLYYNIEKYRELERAFEIDKGKSGEVFDFHFLLALLGLKNLTKVSLTENVSGINDDYREFSLRTMYGRYQNKIDAYYGFITILDNLEQEHDEVVNKWAFEKTYHNDKQFFEMKNVKTFYEYMLGGINELHNLVFKYEKNYRNIVDALAVAIKEFKDDNNLQEDFGELIIFDD